MSFLAAVFAACDSSSWTSSALPGWMLVTLMSACAQDSSADLRADASAVAGARSDAVAVPAGADAAGLGGRADVPGSGPSGGHAAVPQDDGGVAGSAGGSPAEASEVDGSTPTATEGGNDAAAPECDEANLAKTQRCAVCTHQGWVQGSTEGAGCTFLGIPYAKPPIGRLRWTAPQPADRWEGVRDATAFGAACAQVPDVSIAPTTSEDCLFLNVYAPAATRSDSLPVMVFVHGGGFYGGAANIYGGAGLSEVGPSVVVTINYRVGSLGFFAHPDLDRERAAEPSGSDGIRDQQLALRWVQDNIGGFGGDPDNVTVFGESAGGSSACIHLVSPGSRGLIQRFILQSGVCTSSPSRGIEALPREAMYALTQGMAEALCPGDSDVLGCLRRLPATEVLGWGPSAISDATNVRWKPTIEGAGGVLPQHPDELIAGGNFNRGEVIVGTNKNEYTLFALGGGNPATVAEMRSLVEQEYGALADEVMALYVPTPAVEASQAYTTLMTDVMFRCASRGFARALSAQDATVYLYSFEEGAAQHTDELIYVFGPHHYGGGLLGGFASLFPPPLIDAIQSYWSNFAYEGDPNDGELLSWTRYEAASDQHLVLANPPAVASGLQREACDFWDRYVDRR